MADNGHKGPTIPPDLARQANAAFKCMDCEIGEHYRTRLQRAEELLRGGSTILTVPEMRKWQEKADAFLGESHD